MPKTANSTDISVFLIRRGKSLADALSENGRKLPRHPQLGVPCVVIKQPQSKSPWWWAVVETLAPTVPPAQLSLPGAVVFLKVSQRLFALTFGHGYSVLNPAAIEPDFGLKAVLQRVDATSLRSVDLRSMESAPLVSRRQRQSGQAIHAFGIDRIHDLLKGVTGRLEKRPGSFLTGSLLSGADPAHGAAVGRTLNDLKRAVQELYALHSKGYPADFKWVEHLRLLKNESDIHECWEALMANPSSVTSFGPTDPLEGHELGRLRPSWDRQSDPGEAHVTQAQDRLVELMRSNPRTALERLGRDKLHLVDGNNDLIRPWPARRCIGAEVRVRGKEHLLSAGDWFRLDSKYRDEVEEEFDRLLDESRTYTALSAWLPADIEEKVYNERIAKVSRWKLLDRKNHRYGRSQVELCDLFAPAHGLLVHVKRGRHSATLSHLFAQGVVSALTLLQDAGARDYLAKSAGLSARASSQALSMFEKRKLRVVYAISDLAGKTRWRLPFFAMLAVTQAARRLREQRIEVDVVRIDEQGRSAAGRGT